VDDGSNPPAQLVIDSFDDPRLKVVVNTDTHGAAGARNFGMLRARGEIIFFLDDDDEIMPDYCDHILTDVLPSAPDLDYGFSTCRGAISADSDPDLDPIVGKRIPNGALTSDIPFRRKIFGFAAGFWIRREAFKDLGPLAEDLIIAEDTEYCIRLIDAGKSGWYTTRPGVRIHYYTPADQQCGLDHLTRRTSDATHAACVLAIYKRYPRLVQSNRYASRYFAHSYLNLSSSSGRLKPGWQFAATLPKLGDRMLARTYALLKFAAYRRAERRASRR